LEEEKAEENMSEIIDKQKLEKLAKLARLKVKPNDSAKLCQDLSNIFGYMDELNSLDVSGVEAMSHVHGSFNELREDVVTAGLSIEEALQNAPDKSGRFIRVPLIIE